MKQFSPLPIHIDLARCTAIIDILNLQELCPFSRCDLVARVRSVTSEQTGQAWHQAHLLRKLSLDQKTAFHSLQSRALHRPVDQQTLMFDISDITYLNIRRPIFRTIDTGSSPFHLEPYAQIPSHQAMHMK